MRLYTFCNFYLNSISQGIQTAHVVGELFNKYDQFDNKDVTEWSLYHKTIIVLNGGAYQDIVDIDQFFANEQNPYPYSGFKEDEYSLNGMLTITGIVLPDYIYEAAEMIRARKANVAVIGGHSRLANADDISFMLLNDHEYSAWEVELISRMNACGLAR